MPEQDLNYYDTFIRVAADCPAKKGTVPHSRGEKPTGPAIEYELLAGKPYAKTQEEILFETYVRRLDLAPAEIRKRGKELRAEFFSKSRACMRASSLPKKYGWGVHFDKQGRAAIYGVETAEYEKLASAQELKQLPAMRNQRAPR